MCIHLEMSMWDRISLDWSSSAANTGKRLTYAQLTGKQVDSLHHSAAETRTEEESF